MEVIYSDFKKLNKLRTTYSQTLHKSIKIKIGVNDMIVNDSGICVR